MTKPELPKNKLKSASQKLGQALGSLNEPDTRINTASKLSTLKKDVDQASQGDERAAKKVSNHAADIIHEVKDKVGYAVEEQQRWGDESPAQMPSRVSKEPLPHLQKAHERLSQAEKSLEIPKTTKSE